MSSKLDDDILGLLAVDTNFKALPPPQSQESHHNIVYQAAAVGSLKKEESVSLTFAVLCHYVYQVRIIFRFKIVFIFEVG